jgi:hypothetical protein
MFEPVLIRRTPISPTLNPVLLFALLNTSEKKPFLDKKMGGGLPPFPAPKLRLWTQASAM